MPIVLIKNNLKLMLRSKWILLLMIIMPIIIMELLSNAFETMMQTNYEIEEFTVGYRMEESKLSPEIMDALVANCLENKIILKEYPEEKAEDFLKEKKGRAFVELKEKEYIIYKTSDSEIEGAVTESIFTFFYNQIQGVTAVKEYVTAEKLPVNPKVSAMNYYGIIETIYFLWCGMLSLAAVIGSERKNKIGNRLRITPITSLQAFLAKLIPCVAATLIEIGIVVALSTALFDVHWGNPIGTAVILIFTAFTASALGILMFELFSSVAVSIATAFLLLTAWGMMGGSFQTYIYSIFPDAVANWSPLYYINRTLIEFSSMGKSEMTGICIAILSGMFICCSLAGILMINRKENR